MRPRRHSGVDVLNPFLRAIHGSDESGREPYAVRWVAGNTGARRMPEDERAKTCQPIPFSLTINGNNPTLLIVLGVYMSAPAQLLPGTLDLLILKAVSLGPLHGYGVLLRIEQVSGRALLVEQGALYPALFRLVRQGLLTASWGTSQNNRRAKFYELTTLGRKRLREETNDWNRLVEAMAAALAARPEEL